MTNKTDFHDNYGILEPRKICFINCPQLSMHAQLTHRIEPHRWSSWTETKIVNYGLTESLNLIYATSGQVTMKMLKVYEDGNEHHYSEVCNALDLSYGHDIDCWRSLEKRGLIAFSSKHSRGKKYYRITPFGQEVLEIIAANQVYYRIARWFKIKGDPTVEMMKADLAGEESWKDMLPETFNALLEALFNSSSRIRQIGSAYRWMNNLMYLLKTNPEFREKINNPETQAWIDGHINVYPGLAAFALKIKNVNKKTAKS